MRIQFIQNTFASKIRQKFDLKFYGHNLLIGKPNPKMGMIRLIEDNDSISIEHSATELTNKQNQDPLTR